MGLELFQRVGRRLGLSPAGRAIEPALREALKGLQGALERVRASGSEPAGLIRIGTLPTVSNYILAPVLTRLVAKYPAMEIELRLGLTRPQIQELINGDLDVVFSIGPPPSDPRPVVEPDLIKRPVAGLEVSQSLWMAARRDAQNLPALAELRKGLPRRGPGKLARRPRLRSR